MGERMQMPQSLRDVTAEWLDKALKQGSVIPEDVVVSSIEIQHLNSTVGDAHLEGGLGASGSLLVRLILNYDSLETSHLPQTVMCKLTCGPRKDFDLQSRVFLNLECGDDADWTRREFDFFSKITPQLTDSNFRSVKIYHSDIIDCPNRYVIQRYLTNTPHNVRSVIIMEDLSGWESYYGAVEPPKGRVYLCMKNIAALHASFWNKADELKAQGIQLAQTEISWRKARYSWLFGSLIRWSVSSADAVTKKVDSFLNGRWPNHPATKFHKDDAMPDWLTVAPSEDGTVSPLNDSLCREMLYVFAERLPNFYQRAMVPLDNAAPQTLIHGDFKSDNHMFRSAHSNDEVVALDFQFTGLGMVAIELNYFLQLLPSVKSWKDIEDILKVYHKALVENGVNDYNWDTFIHEFTVFLLDRVMLTVLFASDIDFYIKFWIQIYGPDKRNIVDILVKSGVMSRFFVMATSLYMADKENFMTNEAMSKRNDQDTQSNFLSRILYALW